MQRCKLDPWVGKIPWKRIWQLTPVFLPGKYHGQEPGGLQSVKSQWVGHDLVTEQQRSRTICTVVQSLTFNLYVSKPLDIHNDTSLDTCFMSSWWLRSSAIQSYNLQTPRRWSKPHVQDVQIPIFNIHVIPDLPASDLLSLGLGTSGSAQKSAERRQKRLLVSSTLVYAPPTRKINSF